MRSAPLACGGLAAYRAVKHALGLVRSIARPRVAVLGAGGLGQLAIQYVRLLTDAEVVVGDVAESKQLTAVALGAFHAEAPDSLDLPCDVVLDFVGAQRTLETAVRLVKRQGLIVVVGPFGGRVPFGLGAVPRRSKPGSRSVAARRRRRQVRAGPDQTSFSVNALDSTGQRPLYAGETMTAVAHQVGVEEIAASIHRNEIHTVEVAVVDTYGHLRGKRIPAERFVSSVAIGGVNIADAVYVFDPLCEIVDAPTINMGTGYLDMHLRPDLNTFRILTHRPGYAIVFSDALREDGTPHELDPRNTLKKHVLAVQALGYDPIVATELECYLFDARWEPFQRHVQYSSLTDALDVEAIVVDMRAGLLGAGIPVESSNPEYGPGQLEINFGPADPLTTADSTVLFKTIVKQVAVAHGARASFMAKPYALQSGSGMHIHTSLAMEGRNGFGATEHGVDRPNEVMGQWTAGILRHARSMQLLGISTPNGYRRVVANTFCPTHVHWGADNRTVMARLTMHAGNANRVEFRCAGADANAYTAIAGILAAGTDGVTSRLALEPISVGDMYADPGTAPSLPTSLSQAIEAFDGSALCELLGEEFCANYLTMARNEEALSREAMAASPDEVSAWEFERYREHS